MSPTLDRWSQGLYILSCRGGWIDPRRPRANGRLQYRGSHAEVWDNMKAGEMSMFMRLLLNLGLTNPSERTSRNLGLMLLAAKHGIEDTVYTPRDQKVAFVKEIKAQLQQWRVASPQPRVWLKTLPATPQVLLLEYPELYAAVYETGPPVEPPWDELEWARLTTATACRSERSIASMASMGSFRQGPAVIQSQLKSMQAQMLQMQLAQQRGIADAPRFGFGKTRSCSSMTLDNGARLTFNVNEPHNLGQEDQQGEAGHVLPPQVLPPEVAPTPPVTQTLNFTGDPPPKQRRFRKGRSPIILDTRTLASVL